MNCPRCSALIEAQTTLCENCGEQLSTKPVDPLLGRTLLGEYLITKKIGSGGFGAVYQATQASMNRPVAIKVLHQHLSHQTLLVKRFHREGMAASKLDNPSALKMYTSGETEDGYHWIAMEWLDGESLDKRLKASALSVKELNEILGPLCEVLAEAHDKGIYHRDLKPENIMLTPYVGGKILPKLLDFGIAGIADDRMTLAENSMVVSGTPAYMPPEQWQGLAFTDARSDIYALGVIAYQGLCKKLPFRADTAPAWRQQHCEAQPRTLELATQDQSLTPKISAVILKALAKNPEDRYQTAHEFKEALLGITSEVAPVQQRQVSTYNIKALTQPNTQPITTPKLPPSLILGGLVGFAAIVVATAAMLGAFDRAKPSSKDRNLPSTHSSPRLTTTSATITQKTPKPPTPLVQLLRRRESNELLASIVAFSDKELYTAGDFGRVLRSVDAGLSWEALETNVDVWLNGIWVSPERTIFASGADGNILRYRDNKWQTLPSNTTDQLYAITGVGSSTLITVGAFGTILRSTNNGDSWSLARSDTSAELRDVWSDQAGLVVIVGIDGTILRSTDAGLTWAAKTAPSKKALFSVYGESASILFIVGAEGTILRSQDGGESFEALKSRSNEMLNRVWASEANGVFVAGNNGIILRAKDGQTFSPFAQTSSASSLYGIFGGAKGQAFAVGYNNEILKVSPEGNLDLLQSGSTPMLSSIWGKGEQELYVVGSAGSLFRSLDAGNTWAEVALETNVYLSSVWANKNGQLYLVGEQGTLLTSTDGLSWQNLDPGTNDTLSTLYGSPTGDLYIVGGVGLILHSTDNGLSWSKRDSNSSSTLVNLWASQGNDLFVVGLNGTALRSKDSGLTWEKLKTNTTANLIGVWGRSATELYASGEKGTILHSIDGGDTWKILESGTKEELWCLSGDQARVVVVGKNGTVLASTDNGASWQAWPSATTQNLNFVWQSPTGTFYIVGNNGTLLRYQP
jgi:serine/threonine protein kinase